MQPYTIFQAGRKFLVKWVLALLLLVCSLGPTKWWHRFREGEIHLHTGEPKYVSGFAHIRLHIHAHTHMNVYTQTNYFDTTTIHSCTLHTLTCTHTHSHAHSYTCTTHTCNTNSHTEHTQLIYNCMHIFTHSHTYATQVKYSQDWHTFRHICHSHALYTPTHIYIAHVVFTTYIHIQTHTQHTFTMACTLWTNSQKYEKISRKLLIKTQEPSLSVSQRLGKKNILSFRYLWGPTVNNSNALGDDVSRHMSTHWNENSLVTPRLGLLLSLHWVLWFTVVVRIIFCHPHPSQSHHSLLKVLKRGCSG